MGSCARMAGPRLQPGQTRKGDCEKNLIAMLPSNGPLPLTESGKPKTMETLPQSTATGHLDQPLANQMREACSSLGVDSATFLLAAFRAFIFRYTDNDDLVIFLSIRDKFSGLLPIRCQNSCGSTFDRLLASTNDGVAKVTVHNKSVLDSKTTPQNGTESGVEDAGRIAFVYHEPKDTINGGHFSNGASTSNSRLECSLPETCLPQMDMYLEAVGVPLSASLGFRVHFATDLYTGDYMDRFIDNFVTFLSSLIRNPHQQLDEVPMCGSKELDLLRKSFWNMTYVDKSTYGHGVCKTIMEMAVRDPAAIAIVDSDGASISYSELVISAQRVAAFLVQQVATGTNTGKVCVLAPPGINAIVSVLGIVMAGCCYVALDCEFAPERLAFMIDDCEANVVLFDPVLSKLAGKLAFTASLGPRLVDVSHVLVLNDLIAEPLVPSRDSGFYMIYTSGSTGKPKGVVLTHSNTEHMLATLNDYFSFSATDRFLQQSSMCFDLSVVQIFSALTAGASVYVASNNMRKDAHGLADFMRRSGVTVTYFTPTHFALLLEHGISTLQHCDNYRVAMFAGERLPVRVAKAFYDVQLPATVYNTWSPSELVVQTAIHKVDYPEKGLVEIPIGKPLPNCRHYIVDRALNPLPAGVIGELCVGGPQVGNGYLNRPKENAASFLKDPFCSQEDLERGWSRMFRTGDTGCFLPDGSIEFHGRMAGDKQIKLRGYRIDLGEVEQVIYQQAREQSAWGIVDVSVVARAVGTREEDVPHAEQSLTDDRQLVAFIVPKKPCRTSVEQWNYAKSLQDGIQAHLNKYMLPSCYHFLDALPITIGGKLSRPALSTMTISPVYPKTDLADEKENIGVDDTLLHRDELVQATIKLMGASLHRDKGSISPSDNFFDMGGQSISLLRLQSRLRKKFQVTPPLEEMFRDPSPAGIAKMIRRLREREVNDTDVTLTTNDAAKDDDDKIVWASELAFPSTISGAWMDLARSPEVKHIDAWEGRNLLLTGVETYVGVHMLSEMLLETSNIVHVVATLAAIDIESVIMEMGKYRLLNDIVTEDDVRSRVVCIAGKAAAPKFGLSKIDFENLACRVDAIYNLASDVSLLKTYHDLKPANTEIMYTLIDLVQIKASRTQKPVIEIHHLSTWSVPHLQTWHDSHRNAPGTEVSNREETAESFSPPPSSSHGYLKSRWAAEMLLTSAARKFSVPVSIYRASAATGSQATRVPAPATDFTSNMIMHMIQHRSVPEIRVEGVGLDFAVDFVPVDSLVKTTLALGSATAEERSTGQVSRPAGQPKTLSVYHIGSSKPLMLQDLAKMVPPIRAESGASKAQDVKIVSMSEWLNIVLEGSAEQEQLHWEVLKEYLKRGHIMFALDKTRTLSVLNGLQARKRKLGMGREDIELPAMDTGFLRNLWMQTLGTHE